MSLLQKIIITLTVGLLAACGGGGNESQPQQTANPFNNNPINIQCPLGKINLNGVCRLAENICTAEAEKVWVRGHLDDLYLWNNEIKEVSSDKYPSLTPQGYFDALLVKEKDRFSFTMSKREADGFFESGLQLSYGILWTYDLNNDLRVTFVEPNSMAAKLGVVRGDYLISINNQKINTLSYETIWQLLTPRKDFSIQIQLLTKDKIGTKDLALIGEDIVTAPVPYYSIVTTSDKAQDKIGYLLFNDHVATASNELVKAMTYFKEQHISDLVLDLRFNSGGYIYIANELAAMIGGNRTSGKLFTRYIYNNNYSTHYNYFSEQSFSSGQVLPYLSLSRLFVLTTNQTCSASEAIINGLSAFIPVIKIGSDTCGKPYGMFGTNNCDTAYFAIAFKGENAIGQSVPTIGYTPTCRATETVDHALGDPQEGLLASALYYRNTNSCLFSNAIQSSKLTNQPRIRPLAKPQWQRNMIILGDKK